MLTPSKLAGKIPFICNRSCGSPSTESERNVHHSEKSLHSAATAAAQAPIAPRCAESKCNSLGIVALAGQGFCLQHFFTQCYERLDRIDPLARKPRLEAGEAQRARTLLQECANQTLLVCLRHEPLNNLDKSRLLEILLQCSDLQVLLHRPALLLT